MNSRLKAFSDIAALMQLKGFTVGEEVKLALYWATRVATNLGSAAKYDAMRRKLQVIMWQSFRVISAEDFAVDAHGVQELALWLKNNSRRLPESQMVDVRQFITAVEKLVDSAAKQNS